MDELSRSLRVSKRTIYEQFEDKTDLLKECICHMVENNPKIPVWDKDLANHIQNMAQIFYENVAPLFGKRSIFYRDVKLYYPELYEELLIPVIKKLQDALLFNLKKGVKSESVRSDVAFEIFLANIVPFVFLFTTDSQGNMSKYSHAEIFMNTLNPFMRGVLTDKGVREWDEAIKKLIA